MLKTKRVCHQLLLLIAIVFFTSKTQAQIYGSILSNEGDTLSFASIYIKGSSQGTSSNLEGNYKFEIEPGQYEIIYQYVGYQAQTKQITVGEKPQRVDVFLEPEVYKLGEVTINADAEDPAYAVIRAAIKKRKFHLEQIESYACEVYVKGNQKILSIPEKILGQSIGNLDGMLDSSRTGIVYLSESLSKLYYQKPDNKKEVIISSKVSGDDNGYSFNSAQDMEFNVYENTFSLSREIVSPIANNAMNYYKYKLLGTTTDEYGNLINKIKVIRKRDNDPTVEGEIYIIEDLWNVHSFRLNIAAEASQLSFLDSLELNQIFVPVTGDIYSLFSNTISFELKALGIHLEGQFSAVYSDYEINKSFDDRFFDLEVYKVEEASNKRSITYWDSIRPVPLTIDEQLDYTRKDSLQILKKTPAYMDSVDRVNNKFELADVVFGYSYKKTAKKLNIGFGSLIESLDFNTVQGYNIAPSLSLRKYYNELETKSLRLSGKLNYGFSDKRWRGNLKYEFKYNAVDFSKLSFEIGNNLSQYNERPPIGHFINGLYSLFFKRNHARFYNKKFVELGYEKEAINGLFLTAKVNYQQREALNNTTDISYFYKDTRAYDANFPLSTTESGGATFFSKHEAFILDLRARIRIKQKYYTFPGQKFSEGSKYPTIFIHYKQAFSFLGSDVSYSHISASIVDSYKMGVFGNIKYYLNGGSFLGSSNLEFVDRKHFNGNEIFIYNPINYMRGFLLLPYYEYSTTGSYFQLHLEQNFYGYILDKLPLLNNLEWRTVAGAKLLMANEKRYTELHVGLDNIGVGLFKLMRFDFVWSFEAEKYRDFGVRLAIGFEN